MTFTEVVADRRPDDADIVGPAFGTIDDSFDVTGLLPSVSGTTMAAVATTATATAQTGWGRRR